MKFWYLLLFLENFIWSDCYPYDGIGGQVYYNGTGMDYAFIFTYNTLVATENRIIFTQCFDFIKSEKIMAWYKWRYWSEFRHGFPDKAIGTIFPISTSRVHNCESLRRHRRYRIYKTCLYHFLAQSHTLTLDDVDVPDKTNAHYLRRDLKHGKYSLFRKVMLSGPQYIFQFNPPDAGGERGKLSGVLTPQARREISKMFEDECVSQTRRCSSSSPSCKPHRYCGIHHFARMYIRSFNLQIERNHYIPMRSNTYMMALFLYYYCQQHWVLGQDPLCPYPCNPDNNPCISKENTLMGRCEVVGSGVHKSDFKCICKAGYIWEPDLKQCITNNFCASTDPNLYPCHRPGTAQCVYAPGVHGQSAYGCVCKVSHMGIKCNHFRDACIQRRDASKPAGHFACRVNMGGVCTPRLKYDHYECTCPPSWGYLSTLGFSNCYRRLNQGCASLICYNNGKCVSSKSGEEAICVCTAGWMGPHCDQPDFREWLAWEPWTRCTAVCGEGWISRRRLCRTGINSDCGGHSLDLRLCHAKCEGVDKIYTPLLKILLLVQSVIFAVGVLTALMSRLFRFQFPVLWDLANRIQEERSKTK